MSQYKMPGFRPLFPGILLLASLFPGATASAQYVTSCYACILPSAATGINVNAAAEIPGTGINVRIFLVVTAAAFVVLTIFIYQLLKWRFLKRLRYFEQMLEKRTEALIVEKSQTEALLANVLPKITADELIAKGKATKVRYEGVTVLFSDIEGFTKIAEEMNPEILIDELDKFFFHFDSVAEKHNIEKIKTIGDAYMCAGGIPDKNSANPVEVVLAAFEMLSYLKKMKGKPAVSGLSNWELRIGIHTGPVIAGVVGQKKLSYDIWGDTVNIANRMESGGETGKINISGTTYELVKEFFDCQFRGKMPVKYKGEIEMYFVKGILPGLCDEKGEPNIRFVNMVKLIRITDVEEKVLETMGKLSVDDLFFHNDSMARDIIMRTKELAVEEPLQDNELISLRLASVFLITGYAFDWYKPEDAATGFMKEILPGYGFDPDNIGAAVKLVRNSFRDERGSLSDTILHDALYNYTDREDFALLSENLLKEERAHGNEYDTGSWKEMQRSMLLHHEFISEKARRQRKVSLKDQIAALDSAGE